MKDVVEMIREIMDSDTTIILDEQRIRPGNSEVFRLWGDNTLLQELTGFTPSYDIRLGLKETCEWFKKKENIVKYKSHIYNL
jgi:nucleoside-diphosphate-sugar epimerase